MTTLLDEAGPETLVASRLWDEPIVLVVGPDVSWIGSSVCLAEVATLPLVAAPSQVAFDRMLRAQLDRVGRT